MKNSLFNFRDDEEREVFFVAIPVILLFGLLGYWLMSGDTDQQIVASSDNVTVSDTDNDGVADGADRCINRPGIAANYGCPAKIGYAQSDSDGDGIKNAVDRCPQTFGVASNNGCKAVSTAAVATAAVAAVSTQVQAAPDSDGDGIADSEDACAQLAGTAENAGCPADTDNDGVIDDQDQCPDVAGAAIDNGCPADSDGDGVNDLEDECPALAGTNNGCPLDQDNDGVADSSDACPDQAGPAANGGCPADSDGDGVADAQDRCPQIAGDAANDGCELLDNTDTDGDTVVDRLDECPEIAGSSANGCPVDSDGDGISDATDQCPQQAGTETDDGCPAAPAELSEQDQAVLDDALSQVAFNSGSATLTGNSTEVLTKVADLMRKYPQARLEIRGHTDSSGATEGNMRLSMLRARACATFIAETGIDITRIVAYGYGETSPVAPNNTREGRRSNRRVEFELKL